jgi:hypothetical protein
MKEQPCKRTALFWVVTQRIVGFLTDVSGQSIGPILSQVSRLTDVSGQSIGPIFRQVSRLADVSGQPIAPILRKGS